MSANKPQQQGTKPVQSPAKPGQQQPATKLVQPQQQPAKSGQPQQQPKTN